MDKELTPENLIAHTLAIATLLAFSGSFVDCYTYI